MNLLWQSFPMPEGRRAQAWRYRPVYRRPAHFHDEPEFNLVVRGTAALDAGFGSYSRCHQVIRELLGMAPSALLDPGTRKLLAERLEPLSAQRARRDPG
ncbi:hypothetical protein BE04_17030 [Sorangium cellulosum]|uniref:Uncharacterized protein n=2 Tax=Sorangium cellulosum TaxID=56 RepID=A0A150PKW8_SORCE|nr:hypothetical protein [Sorangium cellulosum]AGP36605.1 hypothetical protein SCE1572_20160 [Sorangium cellulosum So0157-2]KYF56322.1 hypothetical protein BE04_17030 [Sorangium cellulosum]